MQPDPWNNDDNRIGTLRGNLLLLAFGIAILGYLVAIGHPEWFVLRPVSSASAAMSQAVDFHEDAS